MSNTEKGDKSDNVRAVARALDILLAFTPNDHELSPGELLKRVDLSRPTLYRLLYTLQESGFLVSVGDPQRFRLGPAIAQLAHVWTSSLDISALAEPLLRRIWEQTRETVALFLPQGANRLCVAELPSPQPLNFKRGVGYTERIARGASGRAILAFMDLAPQELQAYVEGIGLDLPTLQAELAMTRTLGYATSHNELISGAVAVAVPFFNGQGAVAGSMGVFGPEVRLGEQAIDDIRIVLTEQAAQLSRLLGARP
jgi:DNA-binding IclR family transcriptional regulator